MEMEIAGPGIAGIAGVALSQIDNVSPNLGRGYIIDSFMVVVFGGVGNLWGTLVGAFSLGIVNKFLEPYAGAVLGKIVVLIVFVCAGASYVQRENLTPFIPANTGEFGAFGFSGIMRATGIMFFAYIGFDAVSTAAQESAKPQRDLPVAKHLGNPRSNLKTRVTKFADHFASRFDQLFP